MRRLLILMAIAILLPGRQAWATLSGGPGPAFGTYTLEALTDQSDTILICTLRERVTYGTVPDITLIPEQILKLPPGTNPPGNIHSYGWPAGSERFVVGSRILIFLEGTERYVDDGVSVDGPLLTLSGHVVRDMTLQPVATSREVLAIVRAELSRSPPGVVENFGMDYPFELGGVCGGDRLLPAARQWVHSDVPFARCLAAEVFAKHPGPADTAALYELLKDPYTADIPYLLSPWSGHEYIIRQAAVKALNKRGAPVPPVTLFEPRTDLYQPVAHLWIWSLLVLLPVPLYAVGCSTVRRRRHLPRATFGRGLVSIATFACFYFAFLVVLLDLRSARTADDVVFARSGRMLDLTLVDGCVWFETASKWPADTALVHLARPPDERSWGVSLRNQFGEHGRRDWGWSAKPSFDIAFHRYSDVLAYPFGWRTGPRSLRVPGSAAVISYIYFFLLLMFLPTARLFLWEFRRIRRCRRLARNLCPQCAYDLRAHHPGEKCPECGLIVTPDRVPAPDLGNRGQPTTRPRE